MAFIAEHGNSGKYCPENGLAERHLNHLFQPGAQSPYTTTGGLPVNPEIVLTAEMQKFVNQARDAARRRRENAREHG
jgi:hypothetical protein